MSFLRTAVVAAFVPRHWLRWYGACLALFIATLATLRHNGDPHSLDPQVVERSGVHATPWTVAWGIAFVLVLVIGYVHCHHKSQRSARRGRPLEGSIVGEILHNTVPPTIPVVVVRERRPRQAMVEDHGDFTVVDHRRFADEA